MSYPPPLSPTPPPAPRRVGLMGVWFGIGMMVAAAVIVTLTLVFFFRALTGGAEVIDADGQPHELDLPAGEKYGVFVTSERATCEITGSDDDPVRQGPVGGSYTVNDWEADRSFRTQDGDLTFVCTPVRAGADAEVRIGPLPNIAGLVVLMLVGIGTSALLGIGGLVWLIVTIVRRSRNQGFRG